jgi:hypothetical protein
MINLLLSPRWRSVSRDGQPVVRSDYGAFQVIAKKMNIHDPDRR